MQVPDGPFRSNICLYSHPFIGMVSGEEARKEGMEKETDEGHEGRRRQKRKRKLEGGRKEGMKGGRERRKKEGREGKGRRFEFS